MQEVFWVGIGCKRGTSRQLIDWAIEASLSRKSTFSKVRWPGLSTIDTKALELFSRILPPTQSASKNLFCGNSLLVVCPPTLPQLLTIK